MSRLIYADRRGMIFRPAEMSLAFGRAGVQAREQVAGYAWRWMRQYLKASLKHPTGFYESRVIVSRVQSNLAVTDRGVIYGPWLEGVSSRNGASRFKGYHHFRKAGQVAQAAAGPIVQNVMREFVVRYG